MNRALPWLLWAGFTAVIALAWWLLGRIARAAIGLVRRKSRKPEVTLTMGPGSLLKAMQAEVRQAGGDPAMFQRKADDARWALVKRLGPYTREQAELLRVFRDPDLWTIEPWKEPES